MTSALAGGFVRSWQPLSRRRARLADLPALAGGVSAAIGLLVLLGWMVRDAVLTTVVPTGVPMKPNTAVGLVLIGAGLVCLSGTSTGARRRRIGVGLVLVAAAIGSLTIVEFATGHDLWIDQLLFRGLVLDPIATPGRMALVTAILLASLGVAASAAAFGVGRRIILAAGSAALVVAALNLFKIVSAAATPSFLVGYSDIAIHTAVAVGFLGVGTIGLLGPTSPFAPLTGRSATAQLSRRLVAVCMIAPVFVAWARLGGPNLGLYDTAFGTSVMVVGTMAIIVIAILRSASWAADLDVQRERAEEERDRFFELSPDMLVVLGVDGTVRRVNHAWVDTFGYPAERVVGRPWSDFIHPDDLERTVTESQHAVVDTGATVVFTNRYRCADGSYRWLEWKSQLAPGGEVAFAVARDVTVRRGQEERRVSRMRTLEARNEGLAEQAERDPLTGLHNRRFYDSAVARLERAWSKRPADDRPSVAVVMFDLDHFGAVNKQYGHQSGDAVLRAFGSILRNRLRDHDLLARYGGEEFVAVLEGATSADAIRIADSVRTILEATTVDSPSGQIRVTVSAGVAELGEERLVSVGLAEADVWLAQAKRAGRNQVVGLPPSPIRQ